MEENKNYYIGLDMGTDSVGWAATDEEYNFLRLKGKTAFGSRLFSQANSCVERRGYRASGRRMQRRKYRIYLLNQLFAEELKKVDPTFLIRLDNSTYKYEDKKDKVDARTLIFKTEREEKDFYRVYPTIWELRKRLIEGDEYAYSDIRNVYLAIHHIIKYRGNFLKEGEINYEKFDYEKLDRLNDILKSFCVDEEGECIVDTDFITSQSGDNVKEIVLSDNYNKATKQKELKKLFNISGDKANVELFTTLVTGGSFAIKKVVPDYEEKDSIQFGSKFDEEEERYAQELGEKFEIVTIAKEIYDFSTLNKLLGVHHYLSEAMVAVYDEHKDDLDVLKRVIRGIDSKKGNEEKPLYDEVFKKRNPNNYVSFIEYEEKTLKKASLEDFNGYILKLLQENKEYINPKDYENLTKKASEKVLLRTIANVSTSVIPHQLHLTELKLIIKNGKKYYPFLGEIEDKLIALFKYRVPYYYGPLDNRSPYSNVIRKSNEPVTPWNIHDIIDEDQTRVKFMNKLTNNCRYLFDCKVLPRSSLLFEEYVVLDRLNAMQMNGSSLDNQTRKELREYILSRGKTTINNIQTYLMRVCQLTDKPVISGIDVNVAFEVPSRTHLKEAFDLEKDIRVVEQAIFLATVYTDDKKSLSEVLESNLHLTPKQISAVKSLSTKKWATLSRELLDGEDIVYIDDAGVAYTIIECMREYPMNFQMVINDPRFSFMKRIDECNKRAQGELTNDEVIQRMLDETPAMFRRSIHQSLLIIEDLVKITKKDPEKIFIEVTREDLKNEDKIQKDSRKKELETFINALRKDANSLISSQANKVYEELEDEKIINALKLRSKHVYLYFKQLGIDLYTGKPINLEQVLNSDSYDTDHIIPQSILKDDSLDNLVLVKREVNQRLKSDKYPLPSEIKTSENIKLWKYLFDKKSISEKKYNNLVRSTEISLIEIEDFVARQINVVNYSNIVVRNILNIKYPNTTVVFSKAQYPHFLRQHLQIAKMRELNDAHHAVDAYLNVVSGNILYSRFSNIRKVYENVHNHYGDEKTFNMINVLKYYMKKDNLGEKVKNNSLRHDALVTFKTKYNNGAFYKQTVFKAMANKGGFIPLHTRKDNPMADTYKYGGYSSLSAYCLVAIQYNLKGKTIKKIETINSLYKELYKDDQEAMLKTLIEDGATDVQILRYIPLNQKVEFNGGIFYLYSANENKNKLKPGYQNYINNDYVMYLVCANKNLDSLELDNDYIDIIVDRKEKHVIRVSKEKNLEIFETLYKKCFSEAYDSCNYIAKLRNIKEGVNFEVLSLKEQIVFLNEFVRYLSRSSELSKLPDKWEGASNGRLLIAKNITNAKVYIINESPTGLFSKKEAI